MPRVKVVNYTISIDGFGAGPDQARETPLGVGGEALHGWLVGTRSWLRTHKRDGGTTGVDDEFAARAGQDVGAHIMGRNMFGPVRGPWPDETWKGWWGDDPPFHVPVFVLTHHARPPLELKGGTTFHFVTGGADEALARAREAARGKDVQVSGGAETIRQYLRSGAIDEMHFAISPILLGRGERPFEGVDLVGLGYGVERFVGTEQATHVVLRRRGT